MKKNSILILVFCVSGCVIIPPKFQLTGERTLVEKQIAGEYRELEEDAWIVSTIKTNLDSEKNEGSSGDSDSLSAVRIMNQERISSYKAEGAVGESFFGTLKYRESAKYEKDKTLKDRLMRVIQTENDARSEIVKSGAAVSAKKESDQFRLFGEEQRRNALPGEWIEIAEGKWVKKK